MNNWVWKTLLKTLSESHFIKERTKKELLGEKYGISSMRKGVNSRKKEIKKELKGLKESQFRLVEEKIFSNDLDSKQFEKLSNSVRQRISELELESSKIDKKEILMNKRTEWIDWKGKKEWSFQYKNHKWISSIYLKLHQNKIIKIELIKIK